MSIDDKIHYILKSNASVQRYFDKDATRDYENLVPEIKKAFEDGGWKKVGRHEIINQRLREKVAKGELMTGQEFYSRFEKELRGEAFLFEKNDTITRLNHEVYLDAAKKAAGVKDGS